ncbi:hypothetical protein ACIPEN_10440 [Herbaspirillum chlorophenolicum]|uniref:Uncharacterized protein n=1 Tax=Herbaspirillum chlorophenolicum TaxID=211589 RepID=A0ABW8EXQ5_9BURK
MTLDCAIALPAIRQDAKASAKRVFFITLPCLKKMPNNSARQVQIIPPQVNGVTALPFRSSLRIQNGCLADIVPMPFRLLAGFSAVFPDQAMRWHHVCGRGRGMHCGTNARTQGRSGLAGKCGRGMARGGVPAQVQLPGAAGTWLFFLDNSDCCRLPTQRHFVDNDFFYLQQLGALHALNLTLCTKTGEAPTACEN